MLKIPSLGHGIGLRPPHYPQVLDGAGPREGLDWFEIISENFLEPGGNPRRVLRAVRERFPVVMHGVSMSLGSVDPLNARFLDQLSAMADEIQPAFVSDHLCWGSIDGHYAHDLLPLPYTEEALAHVTARVIAVQDRLKRQILVENVSSYVSFRHATMTEWEFLSALATNADCGLLLDVNNVFVSAHNHRLDARAFITGVPRGRVGQIHLAGHSENGELLLDTHDHAVRDEVWELYRFALQTHGPVATLVEWDDQIPSFERVIEESCKAVAIAADVSGKATGHART